MRLIPINKTDPGDFFAVSGFASQTGSDQALAAEPSDGGHPDRPRFEATVVEGEPRAGERYRFEQDDGQTILVMVTEVTRRATDGELVATGEVIGR